MRSRRSLSWSVGKCIKASKDPLPIIADSLRSKSSGPLIVLPEVGPSVQAYTFVSAALTAGVKIAWLETQTGVNSATLRRHYGKWMPTEGQSELRRFEDVDPELFQGPECVRSKASTDTPSK